MPVKLKPLLILTIISIVGCASKPMLVKNVTPEQLNMDNAECRLEAQKATQFNLTSNPFIRANNANTAMSNCLQAKGYAYEQELNEQQKAIAEMYQQAIAKHAPMSEANSKYITTTCRPKEDKEYLACLNEANEQALSNHLHPFPDLFRQSLIERKEYENMLIRKDINRLQFKEYANKLLEDFNSKSIKRATNDVKNGVYTGDALFVK
ncbi:MAG: hypothetical protein ACXV8P_07685 [Methylobacter sp.]